MSQNDIANYSHYISYWEENNKYISKELTGKEAYNYRLKELEKQVSEYDKYCELKKLNIENLSEQEAKKMLETYQDILIEQFSQVSEKGKIIHGDIHPGNIFIDIKGLKEGKKDFFTLIDTGNTIQQNQETALRFLNLTNYIKNADYENIIDFVLEGAKLPQGLDKATAKEKLIEEIKKVFFDNETYTGHLTNDNILAITDSLMQKLNIIPSDTQGNLIKSKTSAKQSMEEFTRTYLDSLEKQLRNKFAGRENIDFSEMMLEGLKMSGKIGKTTLRQPIMQKAQERKNLALLSPANRLKLKRSKSAPKRNSVEYLTYELKQHKKSAGEILKELEARIDKEFANIKFKINRFMRQNGKVNYEYYLLPEEEQIKLLTEEQREEIKSTSFDTIQKLINQIQNKEEKCIAQAKFDEYFKLFS